MTVVATNTDPYAQEPARTDRVLRLREWAADRIHAIPEIGEALIGASDECAIRLTDPARRVSRRHARLVREGDTCTIHDLGSKNGISLDGARATSFVIESGSEIGIGGLTLIAESGRSVALRRLLARILGWSSARTEIVDHALRAVRMAATRRTALVLCSEADPVSIAHGLHDVLIGDDRPFVVCDPRRKSTTGSVRSAQNLQLGMEALAAAAGGSLCVRSSRPPRDFAAVRAALRDPALHVQLVVCSNKTSDGDAFLAVPIVVPPLAERANELTRIIDEYAEDSIAALEAGRAHFTQSDRAWVAEHASSTLAEIETATLRIVALRSCGNTNRAATRLGMAHVSLARWIERRSVPWKA